MTDQMERGGGMPVGAWLVQASESAALRRFGTDPGIPSVAQAIQLFRGVQRSASSQDHHFPERGIIYLFI